MQFVTTGLIVREKKYENDRFVDILTPDRGIIKTIARGALRPKSKLSSSTELLSCIKATIFYYKDYYTLDEAEIIFSYFGLRKDLTQLSLACYFAELMRELAPCEEPADEQYKLILNGLYLLLNKKRSNLLLKAAFELRLMTLSGYMPDVGGCAVCDMNLIAPYRFCIASGRCYCMKCESNEETVSIDQGVMAAFRHIVNSPLHQVFSFSLSETGEKALGEVSEAYTLYHTQRKLRSLEFFHTLHP
jgi:DNA repair protein RecO (recombination protein O)